MKNDKFSIRFPIFVTILSICLLILFIISFQIGSYPIEANVLLDVLLSKIMDIRVYWDSTVEKIIMDVRIPRIILGILVGGSLSVSGASYQTLFKNPMVSPDILGVSAGAGFGAALAMINSGTWAEIQISALLFGLLAVAIAYLISKVSGTSDITTFVLAGVIVSNFFNALLSVVKTYADTDSQLPSITFWLMGSLGKGDTEDLIRIVPIVFVCIAILFICRYYIDVLSTGDEEAMAMGINVNIIRTAVIICSTLMTVISVSICGTIGWVGLVIPHIARMFVGARYSRLLITSFLMGGFFLLLMDNIVRGVSTVQLPLGVLTSLVGTPVFAVLLIRSRRGKENA
ncbi:MAG: iron ABC transporter permease [Tissierellia bacterium]|nr:iron ABC transporter permease [Tissierellia bacterium]